ncbi:MAG: IscS subfamily cysteine desulfurase [Oceanospirillaceae bacterium]|nr:IscS subfamily cysteine desulfurase [Oceanospirillaceae bacterium]
MKLPVYLDYAASTPVDPRVAEAMMGCLTMDGNFANPASRSHVYGWKSEEAVERARRQVSDLVGAQNREIVWTSGATESNNLAIKGLALQKEAIGKHIITSTVEHKAVLDTCAELAQQGFDVTYLKPGADGCISVDQLAAAIREDTILVSLMHVNNEIGTINDIAALGRVCAKKAVCFHVDAAQSVGKIAINLAQLDVDMMSFCAHKIYGPKGVGALYVRQKPKVRIKAQIHGGGHERGMRSGTLPTHQLVGMGESFAIAGAELEQQQLKLTQLRDMLWNKLQQLEGVSLNGGIENRVPGNLNVCFGAMDGEMLLLSLKDIAVSTGSACTSASLEPSYVLKQIGLSDEQAHGSLRISIGRFTTVEEVEFVGQLIVDTVTKLRAFN